MLAEGMYLNGQTLEEQLPEVTAMLLKNFFEVRGPPFTAVNLMKSWMAAMMLTATEMMRLGFDVELGIDKHFLDQAREANKPVHALESADFQIRLLSGLSDEPQEMFLVYTLNDAERIPDMVDKMMTAWKEGDTEVLRKLVAEPEERDERLTPVYEKMFNERNIDVANKIGDLLESGGSWFAVVVPGHFVGETGILRLLSDDPRVEVKQLSATPKAC